MAAFEPYELTITTKGGPLSGNWHHAGRPGKVGGSAPVDQPYLPGLRALKPRQEAKRSALAQEQEEKRHRQEFELITQGAHPRNELKNYSLEEAEKAIRAQHSDFDFASYEFNSEVSPLRTFLLHTTGASRAWYGTSWATNITRTHALFLMDNHGIELLAHFDGGDSTIHLTHLFKNKQGGMLGVKFMGAMKRYADLTGRRFQVELVANRAYFDHFKWLTKVDNMTYRYEPAALKERIINAFKGGPGSGNRGHAGRPGHVGGSAPKGGKVPANNVVARAQANPAFRAWFAGSQVVDEQGNPLVVYHGTPSKPSEMNNKTAAAELESEYSEFPEFDVFNTQAYGVTDSGWLGAGSYFTPDADYAWEFGDRIIPTFLSVKKPFIIEDDGSNGYENIYRFRQSLSELDLPEDLKWITPDTSMPKDREFTGYRGEVYRNLYSVSKGLNEKGESKWFVISSMNEADRKRGSGGVESEGDTREIALARFNDKNKGWEHEYKVKSWISTIIGKEIGARRFTDMLKKAGYDGVMSFSEIGDRHLQEVLVYSPTQIKSAYANQGTFSPTEPSILKERIINAFKGGPGSGNIGHAGRPGKRGGSMPQRYRPSNPMRSGAFKKWFGRSKVVDEDGNPLVVYHGTTHEFTKFSGSHANPENFLGEGFYFTNSQQDVSANYAGTGPDLTQRIENKAEEIFEHRYEDVSKGPPNYGTPAYEKAWAKALAEARKKIAGSNEGVVLPVYLKMTHPLKILDDRDSTQFEIIPHYNRDGDVVDETGSGMKLYQSILDAGDQYGFDGGEVWADLVDLDFAEGVSARRVDAKLRESETLMYHEDDEGRLISSKIIRDIYKGAGFDGVIVDAWQQFGPRRIGNVSTRGMGNVQPGDIHYIVWQPNQIKSLFNQGTFDPKNTDILKEALIARLKGGPGSGNFSHAGRPGHVGGSAPNSGKVPGNIQMANRQRIHSQGLVTTHATPYPTAEAARQALLKSVADYQTKIAAIDVEMKKYTAAKAKLAHEYFLLDKQPHSLNDPNGEVIRKQMYNLSQQRWEINIRKQGPLKKQRKKLAEQRDAAVQSWMSGMQAEDPLKPEAVRQGIDFFKAEWVKRSERVGASQDYIQNKLDKYLTENVVLDASDGDDMRLAGRIQQGLDNAGGLIDRKVLPEARVSVGISPYYSAFHLPETHSIHIVNSWDSNYVIGATYHEFGHWLNNEIPDAQTKVRAFYDRRTKGETPKKLSGNLHERSVMVKRDKFTDPYAGREYDDGATEVMSTGLELMMTDPLRLATRDAEHFNLMLSILRGIPEQ